MAQKGNLCPKNFIPKRLLRKFILVSIAKTSIQKHFGSRVLQGRRITLLDESPSDSYEQTQWKQDAAR